MSDQVADQENKIHDLVIIGAGPAGLAAGIYSGRGGLEPVLLDMMGGGGQVNIIDKVENYPGVIDLETGAELADVMRRQAESFGAGITFDQVEKIEATEELVTLTCSSSTYRARAVLVASGASHRPLKVPGEGRLMGRGVSVCATCDGAFFKGQSVAVVGGGDAAVMEAVYLSRIVGHVTIIHRRDQLRAEKLLQDRIFAAQNVDFAWNSAVEEILGDKEVTGVRIKDVETGESRVLEVAAVFVFVGVVPNSGFLQGVVELDEFGFVKTDMNMQTSHPRIYAAGDLRAGSVRQIGTAVGDGINATVHIQEMLNASIPSRQHQTVS